MGWPDNTISLRQGGSNIVALLGDSITAANNVLGGSPSTTDTYTLGYYTHADFLTHKRFFTDASLNFGVNGETSTQIRARVSSVISSSANICVELSGAVDIANGVDSTTILTNRLAIWNALVAAGITVIVGTILPQGNLTAAKGRVLEYTNYLIRKTVLSMAGVYLWDGYKVLADPAGTNGSPISTYFVSSEAPSYLHPNKNGAYYLGKELASVLNALYPFAIPQRGNYSIADVYHATDAPQGNLLTGSTFAANGGTASTGASGVIAAGFTLFRSIGSTITAVGSKGTTTVGGQTFATQIITVTSGGTGVANEEIIFFQDFATNGSVADTVIIGADIGYSAAPTLLQYAGLRLQGNGADAYSTASRSNYHYEAARPAEYLPEAATGHVMSIKALAQSAILTPQTSMRYNAIIGVNGTVAGSCVITIALPYARKNI